jgi:cytidine deaminase
MENYILEIPIKKFQLSELPDEERLWIETAVISSKQAYAPYSEFNVGAAVILANGQIVTGNNQENAAYPSGLCAERVALFYAGAQYPDIPVEAIVVVATKNEVVQPHISPCGACRQVLLETEKRYKQPIRILMCGNDVGYAVDSAESLLPLSFSADNLEQ